MEKELFSSSESPHIFLNHKAFFTHSLEDGPQYKISKSLFQFYGGSILEQKNDGMVDENFDFIFADPHNLLHKHSLMDFSRNLKTEQVGVVQLLDFTWIKECCQHKTLVDTKPFSIRYE